MHAQLLQSCLTVCDPVDCSPLALLSMGFSWQEYQSGKCKKLLSKLGDRPGTWLSLRKICCRG